MNYSQTLVSLFRLICKVVAGASITYALNIGLTYLLVDLGGLHYLIAFTITQVVVITYGFIYNGKVIFRTNVSFFGFLKYFMVVVSMAALNIVLVRWLTEFNRLYYLVSITIVLFATISLKYFLFWAVVYDPERSRKQLTDMWIKATTK